MVFTLSMLFTAAMSATSPASQPAVPAGWPPLPDFKTRVDYVAWLEKHLNGDLKPADDARPLLDQITEQNSDSEEVKAAKARIWGENERGELPGLFTGSNRDPKGPWDPAQHADWEKVYQEQTKANLHAKLIAITWKKRLSCPLTFTDPTLLTGFAASTKPTDFGLTRDDRLVSLALLPSLAPYRQAVKVLLQNAWRAPAGKVDPDALSEAVFASIRIANLAGDRSLIGILVNTGCRDLAYDVAIRSLNYGVFDPEQTARMASTFSKEDRGDLRRLWTGTSEAVDVLDVLQFAYLQPSNTFTDPPRANLANVEKLAKFYQAAHAEAPSWRPAPPPNLCDRLTRDDPQKAVTQYVDLYAQILSLYQTEPAGTAYRNAAALIDRFKTDPGTHVLLLSHWWVDPHEQPLRLARSETHRRATHLLLYLHRYHARSDKWPTSLRAIADLPPELRIDPFSNKDFCYRVQGDDMTLYSVSINGQDDGGKHDRSWGQGPAGRAVPNSDYVFWPPQNP